MSMNTVFVGDERSRFAYRSADDLRNVCGNPAFISDAVALVFASDKDKPHGIYFFVYCLLLFSIMPLKLNNNLNGWNTWFIY